MKSARCAVLSLIALSFGCALGSSLCNTGYTLPLLSAMTAVLVWLAALPSVFAVLGTWSRVALFFAVLVPFAACESLLSLRYDASINAHTLTIMWGTDSAEALGYLSSAWGWISAATATTMLGFWAAWQLRRAPAFAIYDRVRLGMCGFVASAATVAVLWLIVPPDITPNNGDVTSQSVRTLERVFPWGLPSRILSFARERARTKAQIALSADFRFYASAPADLRVVVMVIGESSRASNWQLGGYSRATNPRLSHRAINGAGRLVWMRNYAANAVATAESVPLMITRKAVGAPSDFAERSIVSAYREAGYSTWWISNQATVGIHDLLIASYAQEAGHIHFENWADYANKGAFDTALLPQVKRALTSGSDKVFIVLHLMGSHYAYWDRYPESDAYFGKAENLTRSDESLILTGSGESGAAGSANETPLAKRWRDSYDNSIRQTDAVLDQVIELLAQDGRPAALVYASDHGELLIEPGCDKRWHGHGAREDVFASALLWISDHPENALKVRAVTSNANLAASGKDLFDTLLDAGNVHVANKPGETHQNSWFSPQFQARTRNVVTFGGIVSADASQVGACSVLDKSPSS